MENLITEITLGKRQGMISIEDSLARLVRQGVITPRMRRCAPRDRMSWRANYDDAMTQMRDRS